MELADPGRGPSPREGADEDATKEVADDDGEQRRPEPKTKEVWWRAIR